MRTHKSSKPNNLHEGYCGICGRDKYWSQCALLREVYGGSERGNAG